MNTLEKLSKQNKEFDSDTYCCSGTIEASTTAVYSNLTMLKSILNKEVNNGLVLSRPPGHHASFSHSSGFCIHNNITYVANECLKKGLRPVIVDWDIHHGDGTQKDFYDNPQKPIKEITKKVIIPSFDEIQNNPRSRSAKLRIAEKI